MLPLKLTQLKREATNKMRELLPLKVLPVSSNNLFTTATVLLYGTSVEKVAQG